MNKVIILILVAVSFHSFQAQAWSYGEFVSCNAINPRPVVTFKTSYGKLIHDLSSYNNLQLTNLANKDNSEKSSVAGLASCPIYTQISIKKITQRVLDKNTTCILPEEIEVFVGYQDPVIYVSNEFQVDSCQFAITLRHEQTHQRINVLTLEYFLPLMDEAIRKAIYDVRAIKVYSTNLSDVQNAAKQLNEYYAARLQPILNAFLHARNKEQERLDNNTHYQLEWEQCKNFPQKKSEK